MIVVFILLTNALMNSLRSLKARQNLLMWHGRMFFQAWFLKMKERKLSSNFTVWTLKKNELEKWKSLSEWMREKLIAIWCKIICRTLVSLALIAPSKTISKLKKEELPDNSENMWSPITTKKRSWELSRTCTQDSIKSVASEDPSSQVDRSRELPLHVPSSRTQRSSSLTRQLLLWMSRVRRLYSKPWIELWKEEHRLWSLIVCQPFRSVIELWSCTRELS